MKKQLLYLLFFVLVHHAQAQITLTEAYLPEVGDTLMTALDGMPTITITAPGGDQSWDYTSLQGLSRMQFIRAASDGANADEFPSANVMIPFGSGAEAGENYAQINSSGFKFLGYAGPDPAMLDLNVIVDFSPPIIERRAPLSFFDINNHESAVILAVGADQLPSELLDSLLISPDSIRLRVVSERLDVVDAWGTVKIPGGNNYEVLREKRREERETRLDAKVGIGPFASWIDVTDFLPFLEFLGRDTITSYQFFSNEAKEPIVSVTVSNDGTDTPLFVEFKSDDVFTNLQYLDTGQSDIVAYPNPAIDQVRFDFVNLNDGAYTLKIFNILGVEVMKENYDINRNRTIQMDIGDLSKGTYLYSLIDRRGKTLSTKRLMVIRP